MNRGCRIASLKPGGSKVREIATGRIVGCRSPDGARVLVLDLKQGVIGLTTRANFHRNKPAIENQFRTFAAARKPSLRGRWPE